MMYLRFVTCLTIGLFGLSVMMMTVLDAVFLEWDVVGDIQRWANGLARKRTRYIHLDDEYGKVTKLATRMAQAERVPPPQLVPARSLTSVN